MEKRTGLSIMRSLVGFVRPLYFPMMGAITLGVLGHFAAIGIPYLSARIVVEIIKNNSITFLMIILVGCGLLRGVFRYGEQALNHFIAFKLLAHIRHEVFAKLRSLAPAKLETKDRGNLIAMITNDVELLEVFYAHTISPIIIAVIISSTVITTIALKVGTLALISVTALVLVGVIVPIITSKIGNELGLEIRNDLGDLNTNVLDSIRGIEELEQYQNSQRTMDLLKQRTHDLNEKQDILNRYQSMMRLLVDSIIMMSGFALLYFGRTLDFNILLLVFTLHMSSFGPVIALSNLSGDLYHTLASGQRILDLLDEKPQVNEVWDGTNEAFEEASVRDVTFSYDNEIILDEINMTITKNKIIALTGESGAGKSTILKLLMRFWDVNEGSVNINDQDIKSVTTRHLRSIESMMSQDTDIFKDTIKNNIAFVKPDASDEEIYEAAQHASVHDFIMSLPLGYDTMMEELGSNLSSGERQRIGLARIFLHGGDLILLDEPTSNLDSLNEAIILKSIVEYKYNKTIVIVSHRASTLKIADEVWNLEDGKLNPIL
ncbi:ABC transporter ATP-binding protein [Erysipelothrix rhusiopathiae]|uniref:amino acid ABC transporter ATP-binding/permease protein n=1 Tax=Erysipelothrix rhusiopathiae TaxID=1648 RepID=UPI000E1B5E8E|nr:ABC transporter ATP-binding protein [Erysipelothrix rhusiopathiae]MCG4456823.1 ABC transporter ATP-binding protein/permease [Erysipelothrix rhusiopathiae]MDE8070976.1 ABC transporter ATP-binding protein [Erysipelothrix rhusiopathiae]MDE8119652.1 ABC transporter ATP-binding protein [Erysipelothrix rhusiopathiae]MDE8132526.1 ABC transporter ATP-binding protein [Erysipelothrix rhusiopathiae]MDE8147786.1 ABC transporter ATP-binding protein [Erysipelothrix rhusiopathiae]